MAWPCENDPDPQGLPPKPLNRDLSLGLSCASSCFLISVASVSTSKARFHHKGCLFFIQGRNVFISVIRTISSVNCNQTQFWFKTKEKKPNQNKKTQKNKNPNSGRSGIGQTSFGRFQSEKPLQREGKGNRKASVFTSTGIENIAVLSGPLHWRGQDGWVGLLC